ncbi:MAG: NAD-dependent deacylase [Chloroflexi bacterium]|nr:NAD-dependent deacylase [Chloroflexota bacterium]
MPNDQKILQAARLLIHAKRVVALTGAGISTPSGVPDFRSPGSGLWKRADPMEVASFWGFNAHPDSFYEWFKPLVELIVRAQPNSAHHALAELEAMGKLRAVITQNIDDLHQRAGSKRVLQVHGHLRQATCIRCMYQTDARPLIEEFLARGRAPQCEQCGGPMKPDVVLFGEMLPVRVMFEAEQESRQCDVMIVAGSSLEVAPAGDLPLFAKKQGAQLIVVNRTPTIADAHAQVVLREDVAVALPKIVAAVKK